MGSAAGLGLWREIVALPRFWAGAIASFDDAWHANSGPDGEAGRAMHEECAQRATARIWRRCWRTVHHPRDTLDTLPAHSRQKPRVREQEQVNRGPGDPPPPSPLAAKHRADRHARLRARSAAGAGSNAAQFMTGALARRASTVVNARRP